jgi:hypothetical protein
VSRRRRARSERRAADEQETEPEALRRRRHARQYRLRPDTGFISLRAPVSYNRHMSMHIVVGLIVAATLALLFLVIPAIALQTLLRLIAPTPARRRPGTVDRLDYVPIEEEPPRPFELRLTPQPNR